MGLSANGSVESRLADIRTRLLDLTRSNRLLNHTTKGARTLRIVDEIPSEVYRLLVERDQTLQFLSREEAPREIRDALQGDDGGQSIEGQPQAALPLAPIDHASVADRHKDCNLQTLLTGEQLQTRLVFLARESAGALEEQGYNILYLTLGIVQWQEAGDKERSSKAPLLFVPVELQRKTIQGRYSIRLLDEDIITNPCLAELCKRSFKFELPSFDSTADVSIEQFVERVRESIKGLEGWSFAPDIHLGLFSFSKLLMYRDLDPESWPAHKKLCEHPLIMGLSGANPSAFAGDADGNGMPDPTTLDEKIVPEECFQVVDADSSQQAAILAAKNGLSMVIEGPPGTGKSQTITNIIAECLAAGKTVLFVSEKSAALEVVKKRLTDVKLGDFVLEMHSRKCSKKQVLQELQRILDGADSPKKIPETEARELAAVRKRLNEYQRQLPLPLGRLELSPFQAIARATALANEPEAVSQIPSVLEWSAAQLANVEEKLGALDRRLARVGIPAQHPWRGTGKVGAGVEARQNIRRRCEQLIAAVNELRDAGREMAEFLGLTVPETSRKVRSMCKDAGLLLKAPRLAPSDLTDARWNALSPALTGWLNQGAERQRVKTSWIGRLKPEAEQVDWHPVLARVEDNKRSSIRFIRPSWYRDAKLIRSYFMAESIPALSEQIILLRSVAATAELRKTVEVAAPNFADLFGALWTGPDSDWAALSHFAESAVAVRQLIIQQSIETSAGQRLVADVERRGLADSVARCDKAALAADRAWSAWLEAIASDGLQWLNGSWEDAEFGAVLHRVAPLSGQMESLQDWVDLLATYQECAAGPSRSFAKWAASSAGNPARGRIANTFKRHFYRLFVEAAIEQRPALQGFRGEDHQQLITRFRDLDERWLKASQHRLNALMSARRPDANHSANRHSKLGILQAEMRKKTRHIPLRRLLAAAGDVVQSIKPCFMMSPLSVAQYISSGGLEFDVVVFDEASQVEPADAYGAIARGRQLLLVGDEKQLPPTNFFGRIDSEEMAVDGDDEFKEGDLESILSLGVVRLPHRCSLRWHYRSRHASLIEFSNQKFYDGNLRVFPSPHTDCSEFGLSFRYVENGVYMRGTSRHNPIEAATVAQEVLRHAVEHPKLSLGVGSLNLPQQRAIEDEIERMRREKSDPRVEQFFADPPKGERFFVKNLESIQGDERDVIFLSIGHGRAPDGRLPSNFGLNGDGGWRRLNVLVTRSRQRCVVFSSIRSDDIKLGAGAGRGVVALKEYLYAAENGRLSDAGVPGGDHDSEFEADVCRALKERGWEVHAQVGCAGFSIDLAVVNPEHPGRYLLGIECDGATYHSSPTARDRDRLRQAVLENLGWSIYRIWSTDWFHRPAAILEELLRYLDGIPRSAAPEVKPASAPEIAVPSANEVPESPDEKQAESTSASVDNEIDPAGLPEGVVEYHRPLRAIRGDQSALLELSPGQVAAVVSEIVAAEEPIHSDEVLRVLAEQFGTRASARSRAAFDRARSAALSIGLVRQHGDFLMTRDADGALPVRYRGNSCPVTRPELIPGEEFEAAINLVLRKEFGLGPISLVSSTIRLMGFKRSGTNLQEAVEVALRRLMDHGDVVVDTAGFLVLAQKA